MRHLNYSHLHYFWAVAKEGSIVKASELLHLTPQTISGQLKLLESDVGEPLFNRVGRRLELSDMGHVVLQYADEIFAVGTELANVVRGRHTADRLNLNVGVVNSMPKLIAERIIAPAFAMDAAVRVVCREDQMDPLLGELATHHLDLVLADQPAPSGFGLRVYNHRLGESGLTFFVRRKEASRYRKRFPESLSGAPLLLPESNSALRRRLDDWFDRQSITPTVVGEFEDSALMKAFGEAGIGIFPGPTTIESEICRMYGAGIVGRTDKVVERYYTISPERKLKHPAVVLITEEARSGLFVEQTLNPKA